MYISVHVNIFSRQNSFHYCVSIAAFTMHFMFFKPVSSGGMFWNVCARINCFLLLVAALRMNQFFCIALCLTYILLLRIARFPRPLISGFESVLEVLWESPILWLDDFVKRFRSNR